MDYFEPISESSDLANLEDCFLLIIDVQDFFMKGFTDKEREILLLKLVHLIKLAKVLNIPVIITAEDIQKNGSIPKEIQKIVPRGTKILNKLIYSCWGQEDIQKAIRDTNRKSAVICGLETDICVSQTAIELTENGYTIFLLSDLTYSRNLEEKNIGLNRMQHKGVIISSLKSWQEEITKGIKTKTNEIIKQHKLNDIPKT